MGSKSATPPYPSAARIADSPCYPQYTASLKFQIRSQNIGQDHPTVFPSHKHCAVHNSCHKEGLGLEEFRSDKRKCQEHFDVYKECKKKEREARLERNRNRSLFS